MSRCLHFESLGGASGDMILGALIGLGVSCEELNQELQSLNIDPFNIIAVSYTHLTLPTNREV